MTNRNEQQRDARRAAVSISAFLLIGMVVTYAAFTARGYPAWHTLPTMGVAACGLAIALLWRDMPSRLGLVVVGVSVASLCFTAWHSNEILATPGQPFTPFGGNKIVVLALAILAPSEALGAILIAAATTTVVVQYLTWPSVVRESAPMLEPWQTVMIGALALGILRTRRRQVRAMWEVARVQAERAWLARVARLSLAVRDLANSQLQTISLGCAVVRQRAGRLAQTLDEFDAAALRLSGLGRLLEPLGQFVSGDPLVTGFDAMAELEREVADSVAARTPVGSRAIEIANVDPRREAIHAAAWLSWLWAAIGLTLAVLSGWKGAPLVPPLLGVVAGVMGIGVIWARPDLSRRGALIVIVAQSAFLLIASWMATDLQATAGRAFAPYNALKVAMLAMMLLAPSGPIGAAILATGAILPIVQTSLWPSELHALIPELEPWLTFVIGLVCIGGLLVQRRHISMMRRAASERAESAWFARFARLTLRIRELSLDPTELLRATTETVCAEPGVPDAAAARMQQASLRLLRLSAVLAPLAPILSPPTSEERSAGLELVEREVQALLDEATVTRTRSTEVS